MIVKQGFRVLMVVVKGVATVLRDRWNNLRTVLVSQNPLKNTGPRAGNIHNQLRYKVQICVG